MSEFTQKVSEARQRVNAHPDARFALIPDAVGGDEGDVESVQPQGPTVMRSYIGKLGISQGKPGISQVLRPNAECGNAAADYQARAWYRREKRQLRREIQGRFRYCFAPHYRRSAGSRLPSFH